jgi:hypothetical protein
MTPSINRLAASAKDLGRYILDSEWELMQDEFNNSGIETCEQFMRWVTGYQYYNALVCVVGGNEMVLSIQLQDDFYRLMEERNV